MSPSTDSFQSGVPGIYEIPADAYHTAEGVSNSMLCHMDPPARLPAYLAEERDPSEAMTLGTLIHARILEPDKPLPKLAVPPETYVNEKGETKPWTYMAKVCKAWRMAQESAGRLVVTPAVLDKLVGCVDAIRADDVAGSYFACGQGELSVFSLRETRCGEVLIRSRIDWLPAAPSNALVDVKKVAIGNAAPEKFAKLMLDRRYHVQASLYLDNWNALMGATDHRDCFVFIVAEDAAPYLVAKYVVDDASLRLGRATYQADLERYAECVRDQRWPGFALDVVSLGVPDWYLRKEGYA